VDLSKRLGAELLGTFWLVFGGCGAAVIAARFISFGTDTGLGIGLLGVSLAFGLTVLTGAYAFGHVSGGHFNPAVTLGLVAARRFPGKDAVPYVVTQIIGGIAGAGVLWLLAMSRDGQTADELTAGGFASNGYGTHSPGQYRSIGCALAEVVLTAVFVYVILGATARRATGAAAGLAIGLCLTLIHLISIPITNTSVNPARSTGPALMMLFGGESWPVEQLWMFWVAPILGAVIAGVTYAFLLPEQDEPLAGGVEAT
jgi:aquaporin Z